MQVCPCLVLCHRAFHRPGNALKSRLPTYRMVSCQVVLRLACRRVFPMGTLDYQVWPLNRWPQPQTCPYSGRAASQQASCPILLHLSCRCCGRPELNWERQMCRWYDCRMLARTNQVNLTHFQATPTKQANSTRRQINRPVDYRRLILRPVPPF